MNQNVIEGISFQGSSLPPVEHNFLADFMWVAKEKMLHTASHWEDTGAELSSNDLKDLLPQGAVVERSYRQGKRHSALMASAGTTRKIYLKFYCGTVYVAVAAEDLAMADLTALNIINQVPQLELTPDRVEVGVWYLTATGPAHLSKDISIQSWVDIERNYSFGVARSLSEIMKMDQPEGEVIPRIILWYGPPGTGKTTAIRTLATEWSEWCDIHIISDPEQLFAHPGYLLSVAGSDSKRWRLVVAEDSDGFLHDHQGGNSDMGRLLNFSDGILGQGARTLFLLTTNEPVGKLHPAVTRPGRCLAQIEFTELSTDEVRSRLTGTGVVLPTEAMTLAELMEYQRDDSKKITSTAVAGGVGQYL